ncbi:MAG: hypothetical protein WBK75_08810 [Acutalibacteraceae bacterium]|jgi:hypothetical protein
MSAPIKTNQLTYTFDKELFSKNYDIFCIRTSEKHFKNGAYIIDAPLLSNNVCSVLFKSGREIFVLMKSNGSNKSLLKNAILKENGADRITISQVTPNSLKDDIVFQLMLNSLGNYESPLLKFNNLTGHLYCFHPNWLIRGRKSEADVVFKVPCLELRLSSEFRLNMEVHTFTSELLRNKIEFKKKKFDEYPKYIFSAHNTLRRKLKDDVGYSFIMRQTKNAKTEIAFLDIQNIDRFNQSKMGILTTVLENFNDRFSSIAHLDFESITDYKALDYTRSVANENKQAISDLLSIKPIKIVDCIDDEYSKIFCKEICDLLLSKYGIKTSCGKRVAKDHLNIRVIHNAAFYADSNDPHRIFNDVAVQHITFEDFSECSEFAISTVIHEMLIKADLVKQKISLFDWNTLGLKDDIDFGIEVTDEQNTKYIFMTIHPDGTFNISEQTLNLFEANKYNQCVEIFENAKMNSVKVHGIIRDALGNINIIKDTEWFTIPEIYSIKAELANGNTKLRGKEKRNELLSSCLDIKMFNDGVSEYYFVGTIGNGMRWLINRAANIRKIEPFEDSILMFEKLLPLMNVTFVHNGQLTIIPFPFKYLREHLNK